MLSVRLLRHDTDDSVVLCIEPKYAFVRPNTSVCVCLCVQLHMHHMHYAEICREDASRLEKLPIWWEVRANYSGGGRMQWSV